MTFKREVKKQNPDPGHNPFAGQERCPTDKELAAALGSTLALWNQLIAGITQELNIDRAEWHSGSSKLGWSMRLQLKKRNIVYFGPRQGWFVAAFALGDKAVTAARKIALPPDVIQIINDSKRYAEGTAVRIDVKKAKDLEVVRMLAKIKVEN